MEIEFYFAVTFTDKFGAKHQENFETFLAAAALYHYLRQEGYSDAKITQVEGKLA